MLALLAATAGVFTLTEGAKLELSPIYRTSVTKVFSPGVTNANIDFRLRKTDHLTVWVTRNGKRVATIVPGHTYQPGWVRLVFDGVSPAGVTFPEGVYVPVVHLGRSHRTITFPNEIRLDTRPPVITVPHRVYTHISPDGDGHRDVFRVPYSLDGPAHAILIVGQRPQIEVTRSQKAAWRARLERQARAASRRGQGTTRFWPPRRTRRATSRSPTRSRSSPSATSHSGAPASWRGRERTSRSAC